MRGSRSVEDKLQVHRNVYDLLKGASPPGILARWLGGIFEAVDAGKPIVYHPFTTFSEIMVAMDVQPLCCEAWDIVGLQVDPDHAIKSVDAAHEAGIPAELCSFDKAIIGSIIRGTMPEPSLVVQAGMPCQNAYTTYQAVAALTGAPLYVCDTPYDLDEEGALDHWVNQYKGMISFIEEHTGKKMDYDRLKEVVEESNRCVEYWLEAVELMKSIPAPRTGPLSQGTIAGMMGFGTPEGTAAMKALLDETKDKMARGETAIPEEKARVIWFHFQVMWDNALMSFMGELGATVPYVLFDDFRVEPVDTSSVERMLRGLAWRALQAPMGKVGRGAFDVLLGDMLYAVEQWKGDCVIIGANPGCKWLTGAYGLIRDACRDRGVPLLLYDVDLVDRRITSAEESRSRIEHFLATVMDR